MSVRSRAPWRPTLLEACSSFSTSAGVRYSRVRRSRLDCLRGGIAGEGAARDLGSSAFLLRPLERTFPFSSVGARLGATTFLGALTIGANITPPLSAQNGNVLCWSFFSFIWRSQPDRRPQHRCPGRARFHARPSIAGYSRRRRYPHFPCP